MSYNFIVIGDRIRTARKAAGKTQKYLARKLGVAYQTLGAWERGSNQVPWPMLEKVAEVIGVAFETLVEGAEVAPYDRESLFSEKAKMTREAYSQGLQEKILSHLESIDRRLDKLTGVMEKILGLIESGNKSPK